MHSSSPSSCTILMAVAAIIPVTQARYLWHPNEAPHTPPVIRDYSQPFKGEPRIVNLFANAETSSKAEESSTKKESSPTAAKSSADPKPTSSDKPSPKETKSAAPTTQKPSPTTKSKDEPSKSASTAPTSAMSSASPTDMSSSSGLLPSSSASPSSSSAAADSSGGGTSSGAVAGIVIGVLAVVGAIAAFVMMRRKKRTRRSPNPDPFTMGFGSHDPPSAYNNTYNQQVPQAVHMPPISPTYGTPPPPISPMSEVPPYQQQQQYYAPTEKSQLPLAAAAGAIGAAATTTTNNNDPPLQQAGGQPEATQQGSLGVFNVVSTYSPTLSDEIDIQLGDRIEILVEYDDGWCQGVNLSRGNAKGVFPRHCVEQHPGAQEPKNDGPPQLELGSLKRVSSMYMAYS